MWVWYDVYTGVFVFVWVWYDVYMGVCVCMWVWYDVYMGVCVFVWVWYDVYMGVCMCVCVGVFSSFGLHYSVDFQANPYLRDGPLVYTMWYVKAAPKWKRTPFTPVSLDIHHNPSVRTRPS